MSLQREKPPEVTTEVSTTTEPLDALLRELVERRASDLHLKPMRPPLVRADGRLVPLDAEPLAPDTIERMLDPIIPGRLKERLADEMAIDFGYGLAGVSRFRTSIFFQRGTLSAVFRRVPYDFPSLEEWGLPDVLAEFCELPQGLVLVTGPTGSGKSSTLAALMQRIAEIRHQHIVTIEDPIEFLITDKLASISQREIGIDTPNFSTALRSVLRQDPDVIMVGEMRDEETIRTVLSAAETGHLVLSTLHTNNASQTVDRVVSGFPDKAHHQIRQQLSACLEAVISLQLVPRASGEGMVAGVEILRRSPRISKLILKGDFETLHEEIETSVSYHKMQTMNQSLAALLINGTITRETAMSASTDPGDLDLLLRKIVGATAADDSPEEDAMAESTSDFSKILELQEVKRHYEELQELHNSEMRERDRVITELQSEITRLSERSEEEARMAELESDNERLKGRIQATRDEYEAKVDRLTARLKELSSRSAKASSAEKSGRGFFRR